MVRRYVTSTVPYQVMGTAPAPSTAIVCTFLEPTDLAAMVGVNVLITGRISRPGSVVLAGLGAATVAADLTWSYMFVPASAGDLVVTATATDSGNGSLSVASITLAVAAAAVYPASITPLVRLDGAHAAMFADVAATVPAVVHGPCKRVNDVAGFGSSNWQGPHEIRDVVGIRLEPSNPLTFENHPLVHVGGLATALNLNDCTFAVSWTNRLGDPALLMAGVPTILCAASSFQSANGFFALAAPFRSVLGARHTVIFRPTPTGVKVDLWTNAALTGSTFIAQTIASGHPNAGEFVIGQSQSWFYGTVVELSGINRAISDSEAMQLAAFMNSIPSRPAYPIDQPLIAWTGDSNVVGVGATQYSTAKFSTMRAMRSTYNPEMVCTAIVGTSTAGHAGYIAPYYDARRAKNIAIFEAGTNDLAAGYGAVADVLPVAYAQMGAMRAQGWKVIAATLPDRTGLLGVGYGPTWRAQADTYNAGLRAAVGVHCDAVADLAAISAIGAPNASTDLTYFSSDAVHLNDAGQAQAHPAYLAAIQSLLA